MKHEGLVMSELKLEVGKSYRSRGGEQVTITEKSDDGGWPFIGIDADGCDGLTFRSNGTYSLSSSDVSHYDLIEEWDKPILKLKVGKTYTTRGSKKKVKIIAYDPKNGEHNFIGEWEDGSREPGLNFTEGGRFLISATEDKLDLVKEVEPLQVKVGKKYITKSGAIVVIKSPFVVSGNWKGVFTAAILDVGQSGYSAGNEYQVDEDGAYSPANHTYGLSIVSAYSDGTEESEPKKTKTVYKKQNDAFPWGDWIEVEVAV